MPPVKQQKVWQNTDPLPYVGGMLSTAGGLVFHGDLRGWFKALDAKDGRTLWQFNTGSGISAAPMTYELDGKQYVAVVSGRTFAIPAFFGPIGEKMVAASVSIWMPGALKVDPFPDPAIVQFEWYVPIDVDTHMYWRVLGKRVASEAEAAIFGDEFHSLWKTLALHGFNE